MSRSSEAAGRLARLAGGRRGLAVLILAALVLLALRPSSIEVGVPLMVRRGDLVLGVEVEGELVPVRSTLVGVPPVTEVSFKIAFLAPEGAVVRKGEPVLRFDAEALSRLLAEKRAELAEAEKKLEQKRLELEIKRIDLAQRSAQARAELAKAQLKAEVPAVAVPLLELKAAELDRSGRERDLENLRAESRVTEASVGSELRSLAQQRERAAGRVQALERAIEAMTVPAPQAGVVVYQTGWNDEKKKIGDSVWWGEKILGIPDLAEMKGDGFVDEADGGPVSEGQPVLVRLEARSDLDLRGRVARIARSVRQRSWRTPGKGFQVEIAFERTDPSFMRPAMRFRGEIETGRVPDRVLVPREAVFLRDSGPVAWRKTALGWRETRLRLGRTNRSQVEVLAGLAAGELVSPFDPAAAEGRPRGASPVGAGS